MALTYEEEKISALEVPATVSVSDVVGDVNTHLESEMSEESLEVINHTETSNRDSLSSINHTTYLGDPKRRTGILSDLEREFVKDYGKKCLMEGKNVDNNCMFKEYRNVFPGYTRDGEILKKMLDKLEKRFPSLQRIYQQLKKVSHIWTAVINY